MIAQIPATRMLSAVADKRVALISCILCSVAAAWIFWVASAASPVFRSGDPRFENGDAARGADIFAAGQCASCHASPGQENRLKLGGGLALASPFGTFRVPNISPDGEDGIGAWTGADLANALILGVSPSQQHYYPAFPYMNYTAMDFDDVADLFAYLRTLEPVAGRAPPHDLPLIFRNRRLLGFWKLLFFDRRHPNPKSSGDPTADRGAYLVETLAHCGECHSSRNFLGAVKPTTRYAGGIDPEGTGFVPNITPDSIGHWSEADISEMLKSGRTPDHGRVGSSMADVVTNMALLPQRDRDAVARYIKSLPAKSTPKP